MRKFWTKQYKWILIAGLAGISPVMSVCAEEPEAVQESVEDLQVPEQEEMSEPRTETMESFAGEQLFSGEVITQTITDTGEELVEQIGEEIKEKAKEVKHNILLTLWEHIKQMFHDFFASIFGENQ